MKSYAEFFEVFERPGHLALATKLYLHPVDLDDALQEASLHGMYSALGGPGWLISNESTISEFRNFSWSECMVRLVTSGSHQ